MKVLVTGFEPFGGENINPAYEAVQLLPNEIDGAQIIKLEIPTVYEKSGEIVTAKIKEYMPDIVISVGQAGGRGAISIERVALNLRDASVADNDGNIYTEKRIKEDGDDAYFATIPIKAMKDKVAQNGIPSEISLSAGTYVCNDVMYTTLYELKKSYPNIKAGFIHVPYDIGQVASKARAFSSMPIEYIVKGLQFAISAAITESSTDCNG